MQPNCCVAPNIVLAETVELRTLLQMIKSYTSYAC